MAIRELYQRLQTANSVDDVQAALTQFEQVIGESHITWRPVGDRENNRGTIEVSADPGRSIVERVTNAIDAILEAEHEKHHGLPECGSPREAAITWLNIPEDGLSAMTQAQRQKLAQRCVVRLLSGEARESRIVEVRDHGIGVTPSQLPATILSLNESNKMQKHYLAGAYGQGGSSTFAAAKYVFIASRQHESPLVGFTVVKYHDLPPETFKIGRYAYLTIDSNVLEVEMSEDEFPPGTFIRHFGYDLSKYPSPVGPSSLYGLLNEVMFDPIVPIWLDSVVHGYRRVIKGSRNALNGAVDEGDEERRGPKLAHNVPLYFVKLGDFGRIGIEYWVLDAPDRERKRPNAAFVNPAKPIILTLNGQNQAELSQTLIRKDADLPFLSQRLICHLDCNSLTAEAKRALFVSTREDARKGLISEMIEEELVKALRSDDTLNRLNSEARDELQKGKDEAASETIKKEVSRLLKLQGATVGEVEDERRSGERKGDKPRGGPRPPRPKPQPIELHEPPTFLRIVWAGEEVPFYPGQRRYIRIETDAASAYHNPKDPQMSRVNVIVTGISLNYCGSTPLRDGRMRVVFEAPTESEIGRSGTIRVELSRVGLSSLSDERVLRVIEKPSARPATTKSSLPPFDFKSVDGPDSPLWSVLEWPDDVSSVACSAQMEEGTLVIYYSTVFPNFEKHRSTFEQKSPQTGASFVERYKIWLAVHALLAYQDQQAREGAETLPEIEPEVEAQLDREERCRVATMSALIASREMKVEATISEAAEE